jgi:hypothetical protein
LTIESSGEKEREREREERKKGRKEGRKEGRKKEKERKKRKEYLCRYPESGCISRVLRLNLTTTSQSGRPRYRGNMPKIRMIQRNRTNKTYIHMYILVIL